MVVRCSGGRVIVYRQCESDRGFAVHPESGVFNNRWSDFVTRSARTLLWGLLFTVGLTGCAEIINFRSQTPDEDEIIDLENNAVETDYLAKMITIAGTQAMEVKGVGLVTGLDGTGGDPPPSIYRSWLLDDMRRRKVRNPNQILRDPNTALVVVRAYIPPVVKKGDEFDVEIALPPNSDATSLRGGWLMECLLTEQAIVPGRRLLKGHTWATAKGAVLVSAASEEDSDVSTLLKRGRVLGGGKSRKERTLGVYLQSKYISFRNARRVENRINQRFFGYKHGQRKGLATAKTDEYIQLDVQENYKNNHARYLQVVRQIAFRENTVQERERLVRLQEEMMYPPQAAISALRLEAIGKNAVPYLKQVLQDSPSLEVRFYAAEALAYLGDNSGAETLIQAAREERAFRVFALAALSIIDDTVSYYGLRQLINEESVELRVGAVRALCELDENDQFIRGDQLNDQFTLRVLPCSAEPLVHLTRSQLSEIIIFGDEQRMQTPVALTAGPHIMVNARAGDDTITVSRFKIGEPDEKKTVSTRVADVVRAVADLGASYPDVAQMLAQAGVQYNLPGRLEVDSLPQAGRVYFRPTDGDAAGSSSSRRKSRVGGVNRAPNLYPVIRDSSGKIITGDEETGDDIEELDDTGEASVTDTRTGDADEKPDTLKKPGFFSGILNLDDDE